MQTTVIVPVCTSVVLAKSLYSIFIMTGVNVI